MKVTEILTELGIVEYVMYGEPTSESEFNTMFKKVTGADENGFGILSSDTSDFGVTWSQIQEKKTELTGNRKLEWDVVRIERDRKLAETDWRASSDLTLSTEWATYRQALRDITNQSDPSNVTWPSVPS